MICSNYRSEQPDQAKFCSFCGSTLQRSTDQPPMIAPRMQAPQPQAQNSNINYYQQPQAQYPTAYQDNYGQNQPYVQKPKKDKVTAGILAIILGGIGVHKFYLDQIGMGILYLVFC